MPTTKQILASIDTRLATIQKLVTSPLPTPIPVPIPVPTPTNGKWVFVNAINWGNSPLTNLPLTASSELSYFILPVSITGSLIGSNPTQEKKFVADVHAAGKKATFSVGGGSQNVGDITVSITNNRDNFINSIIFHLVDYNYDGLELDIENTNINPQVMVDFIRLLRSKLDVVKKDLVLGVYTQPYQLSTVWSNIDQAKDSITWLSPMIYDFPNSVSDLITLTKVWLTKVPKEKLLAGIAVNYDDTGLNQIEFKDVLDFVNTEGLKGVAIWNDQLYIQSYQDILKSKFTVII